MKTAFTLKRWYWGDEYDTQPRWWKNFCLGRSLDEVIMELHPVAKAKLKSNGKIRVVFNSPEELSFFILRWS